MDKSSSSTQFDFVNFLLKTLVLSAVIVGAVLFLTPDFSILKKLETDQNKLIALSLIQNPRVLWKLSEIDENKGKLANAIRNMELAIGLLEMHGSNIEVRRVYEARLYELRNKNK